MVKKAYNHGQFQGLGLGFSVLFRVGSLLNRWLITLFGKIEIKIIHENNRIKNHGLGFNWGISLRVVGNHQNLA